MSDQNFDSGPPRLGEDRKAGRARTAAQGREPDVSTPSLAWECMAPRWRLLTALLGGTTAMREAGEEYLPRHQYEEDRAYAERLSRSVLKNYVEKTLSQLVGKAFKDPPSPGDDVPDAVASLLEDVDGEGHALGPFAQTWFREGVGKAFAGCLVDFSRTAQAADAAPRTLADDRTEGVRPFWRLVSPEDLLSVTETRVNGRVEVTEARIQEHEVVPDGRWGQRLSCRVRVLYPGGYELWEKVRRNRKEEWEMVEAGQMDLPYVPLVLFYTSKHGTAEGKPVLEDLAHLNVAHWQSGSDQTATLTVARFPLLAVSGATLDQNSGLDAMKVGPKQILATSDPQGKFYFVEHTGAALEAGRKDLEALEEEMRSYGAQFTSRQPGNQTATGRVLDSAEAISPMQGWVVDFKDCLEEALRITADWLRLGDDAGGSVVFEVEPDAQKADATEMASIEKARDRKDISRVAYVEELKRRDILREDYDAVQDQDEIDAEAPEQAGPLTGMLPSGRLSKAPGAPPKGTEQ